MKILLPSARVLFLLVLSSVLVEVRSFNCSRSSRPLAVPRYGLAAATASELSQQPYALFAGGFATGGAYSDMVDIFNSDTGTWLTTTLSQGRSFPAGMTLNKNAVFAGGDLINGGVSAQYDHASIQSGTLVTNSNTLPSARAHMAAANISELNLIIFAGGVASGPVITNEVMIYNASNRFFNSPQTLSANRTFLAATSVGRLALFGGGEQGLPSAIVDIYNGTSGTWSNATLSLARSRFAATTVGGMAIFAGGMIVGGATDRVDIFHVANSSWTTATLSQARYALTAVTFGNLAFFAGGADATNEPSDVVDIYNASSNSWTTMTLSAGWWGLTSVAVGRFVIFAGGNNASGTLFGGIGNPVDVVDICEMYPPSPRPSALPSLRLSPPATPPPSASLTPSPSAPPAPTVAVVEAQVNLTFPVFTVINPAGQDNGGGSGDGGGSAVKQQKLEVEFASVSELDEEGRVVRSVLLQQARWNVLNISSANTNTSSLVGDTVSQFVTDLSETESLIYTFFTFADERRVSLANNFSFAVSPAFFKFSLSLNQWNWTSPGNRLQFALELRQQFDSSLVLADTPQEDTTSMFLFSRAGSKEGALIRLLEFGLTNASQVVPCSISLAEGRLISITFDYFATSLEYDPDFSLLVDKSSSGSDDMVWIAAVVVVPVAVLLVIAAIVVGSLLVMLRQKRRKNSLQQVNFTAREADDVL